MNITPPDIVIVLILGYFTFNGLRHGFIEELARLVSLIGGFILASKFHQQVIPFLQPYFIESSICVTVSYLIVFVVSAVTITIIANILQKFIEFALLGWLNRLLGLLLGMLKGFLIVSLFLFIIQAIPMQFDDNHTIRQKLEQESIMYQICNHVKELVILTIPIDNKLDNFQQKIKELSDEKKVQDLLNSP
tara:strand:- start:22 stop:594 length:573 start_codon:yes stop_codon:yes gene_type:complete